MARHERRAEAGRKGRLWLGDADLGARDLGGIAGQEVIHGLIGRQPGDRRQYAERIGGQNDDVAWQRPHNVGACNGDAIETPEEPRDVEESGGTSQYGRSGSTYTKVKHVRNNKY